MCLNFASAKNPGGGFLSGSQAQEESLARASALYPTLTKHQDYYQVNRHCHTCLYTDHMIFSPEVVVFRDDDGALLEQPYTVTFVTAPAVNAGAVTRNERHNVSQIPPLMRQRMARLLMLCAQENCHNLVLGAWGCGVFGNDAAQIANLWRELLIDDPRFANRFQRVVFAVLDRQNHGTFDIFNSVFANQRP